jgi:deazaflavin-dependent oxidoreductase (nitroreductase family)
VTEEQQARNRPVVEEFRANGGLVGGMFEGVPLLLLHHTGAKSGAAHIAPLAYLAQGASFVVVAANGGRPYHPGWFHNLRANPDTVVEVGTDTHRVRARVAEGAERERLAERFAQESKFFSSFAQQTEREIPVIVLEPLDGEASRDA